MTATSEQRDQLRLALQSIRDHAAPDVAWDPAAPDLLIGILASDVRLAIRALRDWTQAMRVAFVMPESRVRVQACGCLHCVMSGTHAHNELEAGIGRAGVQSIVVVQR
jgi:hypothetical protein